MGIGETNRRQFFRGTGLAAGTLAGLGLDLKPAAAAAAELKIQGRREVPSVCPYCAVGCGQIVSVRDGQIVNIEGNPDSPINRGTLCPKGAATFQLAVNPNRLTKVKYRAPYAKEWDEKDRSTGRWTGSPSGSRRRATPPSPPTWTGKRPRRQAASRSGSTTAPTIASLGGATMDNEWNYVQLKLCAGLGLIWLENQARI